MSTFVMGAVAYDPKVVTIWDGFQAWFERQGFAFDYVLYQNYERLVAALLGGHVHAAWNSPLAWLQAEAGAARRGRTARAIVMRDSDRDLTSVCVVRADGPLRRPEDLAGRRVGVGAGDSPQATIIPLGWLAERGIAVEAVRHDRLLGKHGDHIGGERDAARALLAGEVDAAWVLDANHLGFSTDGTWPSGAVRVVAQTGLYDHCNMTVLDGCPQEERFTELLLAMSYGDPEVRPLLDLEGLKAWKPGRTEGYAALAAACARFGTLRPFLAGLPA